MQITPDSQLRPIFSTDIIDKLEGHPEDKSDHCYVLGLDISKQLGCQLGDIVDYDLCLADAQSGELMVALIDRGR